MQCRLRTLRRVHVIRRVTIEGQCALNSITDNLIVFDNEYTHSSSIHARPRVSYYERRQVVVS